MIDKVLRKFKDASPASKASMALLTSNFILKGISLISGPVFTRLMSTEQYGIVSTFLSWQSLLSVFITLNLAQGVFNNGMLDFKEDRERFQLSLLIISSLMAIVALIVFLLFKKPIVKFLELPEILVYVLILHFLTVPAYSFWSGRQRYEYKYKALVVISIGNAIGALLIGVLAVLSVDESETAIARICSMEGVSIAIGVFFCIYISIKAKFKPSLQYCRYALRFNIPLLPHYLSMYVLSSSDRIMITKMVNASATAVYSVAYTIASVITIFWQSIEASLSPWIYEKLNDEHEDDVNNLTWKIMLFFAVICMACTLFAPEIMMILAPKAYAEGIYAIPAVAAGVFFTAMYSLYMRVELFYKKTGFATIATTIAAILNIVLNYIFIQKVGYIAAGYTTMACYALLALFHYCNVKYKKYDTAFNNKAFLIIGLIVVILSGTVSFLYSYIIIRYVLIVSILIVLFIFRKRIISLLKR